MKRLKYEEFVARLEEMRREFPDEAEKALNTSANKMVKALKEKTPISGINHPRKLRDSWRKRIKGNTADELRAEIYSVAPHFHLVDRGHVMKNAHGTVTGYKQGKHFVQKIVDQQRDSVKMTMREAFYRNAKKKFPNG